MVDRIILEFWVPRYYFSSFAVCREIDSRKIDLGFVDDFSWLFTF